MDLKYDISTPLRPVFPFTGIIGQEELKKALLLNCICPTIGGVLISGEKGTAKSTIVRSLESLLPNTKVVTLPLNATEDMVLGSLDFETALKHGRAKFQPGVLAKAHGNILYIDEVNLLSESLINVILDAAASGRCTIEREGISRTYPSRFILIGSMNPEEGALRPQILDRFGFYVEVHGDDNLRNRLEIMKNRMNFERNPESFIASSEYEQTELRTKIRQAMQSLPAVQLKDDALNIIAEMCQKSFIAGHRGDLALCDGARAHAALSQNRQVTMKDIEAVGNLALAHRIRSVQSPPPPGQDHRHDRPQDENQNTPPGNGEENYASDQQQLSSEASIGDDNAQEDNSHSETPLEEELFDIGALMFNTDVIESIKDKQYRSQGSGRRSKTKTHRRHGHYVKVKLPGKAVTDLAFDATLRAAAPFQKTRRKNGAAVNIKREDIRVKIREKRIGHTVLFVLDASGSMGINRRMSEAKAAVFELLKESYKKRDTVGLMKFNRHYAELVLQPTRSLDLAYKHLKEIKTGGRTPLEEGIEKSTELMKAMYCKNPEMHPVVIILSDGRANHSQKHQNAFDAALKAAERAAYEKIRFIVVDTETGFIRLGLAKKLARSLDGEYYTLDELKNIKEIINKK